LYGKTPDYFRWVSPDLWYPPSTSICTDTLDQYAAEQRVNLFSWPPEARKFAVKGPQIGGEIRRGASGGVTSVSITPRGTDEDTNRSAMGWGVWRRGSDGNLGRCLGNAGNYEMLLGMLS